MTLNRYGNLGIFLAGMGICIYAFVCAELHRAQWLHNVSGLFGSINSDTLSNINLDTLSKIGPFISGVSLAVAAIAALLTLFIYNRKQNEQAWLDSFRALYAAFWNDNDMATLRSWIISDKLYNENLKPVLDKRNQTSTFKNNLDQADNDVLEKVDRFCAVMVRARSFGTWRMSRRQRRLWAKLLYNEIWDTRNRPELKQYISAQWGEIL